MSIEINKRIAMYRKLLNLSQAKVAELMNMKSSTYSQMERGGSITCDRLLKLAEIFSVSPQYLLCGTTEEKPALLHEDSVFENENENKNDDPPLILSKQEENYIKILRYLKKDDRKEVIQFLQTKFKETRKKNL